MILTIAMNFILILIASHILALIFFPSSAVLMTLTGTLVLSSVYVTARFFRCVMLYHNN